MHSFPGGKGDANCTCACMLCVWCGCPFLALYSLTFASSWVQWRRTVEFQRLARTNLINSLCWLLSLACDSLRFVPWSIHWALAVGEDWFDWLGRRLFARSAWCRLLRWVGSKSKGHFLFLSPPPVIRHNVFLRTFLLCCCCALLACRVCCWFLFYPVVG